LQIVAVVRHTFRRAQISLTNGLIGYACSCSQSKITSAACPVLTDFLQDHAALSTSIIRVHRIAQNVA
jgi:hypothetical protein